MFRRLLLLSFVAAIVAGFTLPVFAQEDAEKVFPGKDLYKFEGRCKCFWKVNINWPPIGNNGPPDPATPDPATPDPATPDPATPDPSAPQSAEMDEAEVSNGCFGRFTKFVQKPFFTHDVVVTAELVHPFLTAHCKLDKHKFSSNGFEGSCEVERCKFDFELERIKRKFPHRPKK
jgi:hypothetical protein